MSVWTLILIYIINNKQNKVNYNIKGNKQENPLPPVQNPALGTDV